MARSNNDPTRSIEALMSLPLEDKPLRSDQVADMSAFEKTAELMHNTAHRLFVTSLLQLLAGLTAGLFIIHSEPWDIISFVLMCLCAWYSGRALRQFVHVYKLYQQLALIIRTLDKVYQLDNRSDQARWILGSMYVCIFHKL